MMKNTMLFLRWTICVLVCWPAASFAIDTCRVDPERICAHIEILASDDFEGREIATRGEAKTLEYLKQQFAELGLRPIEGDSYLQEVRLAKFNPVQPSRIRLDFQDDQMELKYREDFLLASTYAQELIGIDKAEVVFAGFGIHAPEIGWDDYDGIDVNGKVVVVLYGDPSEYTEDEELWKGDPAANVYGKTFYKKNEAAQRGAVGLISIYKDSKQDLYNWESIANYVGVNDLTIYRDTDEPQLQFSAVISRPAADRLFEKIGLVDHAYQSAALKADFRARSFGAFASFSFSNVWEDITTYNVAGLLPGTDLADEVMIYSAHWDHVGIRRGMPGDSICNGAVDNASGTSALIEAARTFAKDKSNRRSVLFLATGAEEVGLLGSIWYNAHPLFPHGKTVVNFNMDAHFPYGKTSHITGVVYGRSELDKYLEEAARRQRRVLVSNEAQNIAMDIFFRSDHFPFIEKGIPAEFAVGAGEAVGHDNEIYQQKMAAYGYKYHQPSDEYEPDFDCAGIAQDAELVVIAGKLIDREAAFPMWYDQEPWTDARFEARYATDHFVDVSQTHTPVIATQGRTMDARPVDIDMDGDLDLVITGEFSYNVVLENDGKGRFSDVTKIWLPLKRHDSEDIASADFNGDGFPDLCIVSEDDLTNEYYLNKGGNGFEDHSERLPVEGKSNAVITLDINNDGHSDLLIGNDGVNYCLLNDGVGGWIESPERIPQSVKTTQDMEAGDVDGDGDLDIICGNEDDSELWINDGKGFFTDETADRLDIVPGKWETREADFGDIDGDGDLDIFLANVNFRETKDMQNRLLLNDGEGHFKDVTADCLPAEEMHTLDGDFVDLDGDGDLDIITANAFGGNFACYTNDGKGVYRNTTDSHLPASVRSDGIDVEAADFNGDGKLDLYICNFRGSDHLLIAK